MAQQNQEPDAMAKERKRARPVGQRAKRAILTPEETLARMESFPKRKERLIAASERTKYVVNDRLVEEANDLLERITVNPQIFGGKPIIRGHRLAVEHVLAQLAAGDSAETLLACYPWLEIDDIRACLLFATKVVGQEYWEPRFVTSPTGSNPHTPDANPAG